MTDHTLYLHYINNNNNIIFTTHQSFYHVFDQELLFLVLLPNAPLLQFILAALHTVNVKNFVASKNNIVPIKFEMGVPLFINHVDSSFLYRGDCATVDGRYHVYKEIWEGETLKFARETSKS